MTDINEEARAKATELRGLHGVGPSSIKLAKIRFGRKSKKTARARFLKVLLGQPGSTLCGRSTLRDRGDGFLIGLSEGGDFDAAITFRQTPTIFVRLAGGFVGDEMVGGFSAYSSDGGFWWGNFSAMRADPASEVDANYLQDADLVLKPTVFIDPEAIWSEQQGKEKRDTFEICYSRNTVLMCRNKPMIWQWWL
jgi:hypothetical protein